MFFGYYLDVLYWYLHVFSNYKTLESPYDVTNNEHEYVLHTTLPYAYMYTYAGTAIVGMYCVDVRMHYAYGIRTHCQTGCLARVPVPSIRVYEHTTQSSYGPSVLH